MITWNNVKEELVAQLQSGNGTTIFISNDQAVRIWGITGTGKHIACWCEKHGLSHKVVEQGHKFWKQQTP